MDRYLRVPLYDAPECDRPGLAAYQPEVINKQSAYDHENR
jgi:hypothetical protein